MAYETSVSDVTPDDVVFIRTMTARMTMDLSSEDSRRFHKIADDMARARIKPDVEDQADTETPKAAVPFIGADSKLDLIALVKALATAGTLPFLNIDQHPKQAADAIGAQAALYALGFHLVDRLVSSSEATTAASVRMVALSEPIVDAIAEPFPGPGEPIFPNQMREPPALPEVEAYDAVFVVIGGGGVFVEVEDALGVSLSPTQYHGEWIGDPSTGLARLRIPIGRDIAKPAPAEPVLDYKDRARMELAELIDRTRKLHRFVGPGGTATVADNPAFANLPPLEKRLLADQHDAMSAYVVALATRIANWDNADAEDVDKARRDAEGDASIRDGQS